MNQLGALTGYAYGGSFGDGPDAVASSAIRPEWTLCAFDGERMAASYAVIPFTMRAHGTAMALGGVSTVATEPEYRRQGLARRLTTRSFEDMFDREQPVAALWASQAAIYQRYGYAQASVLRTYTVDTVDIDFVDGDPGSARVERFDVAGGRDRAKEVYNQFVADRMCYLHRARTLWDLNAFTDNEADGPVHVAVAHDDDNRPVGYVVYTLRAGRLDHPARSQELVVRDLAWLDLDAYRSLWSWLKRHDLVGRVSWNTAPLDDPASELFAEPRLLRTVDREGIWFRVVDVERALAGRRYTGSGAVTIEIPSDDLAPWNPGTYRVEVDEGEAAVTPTTGGAGLTVPVKALSSMFTGFRSPRSLARWGLLAGDAEAVATADALFAL
ncbi:MAG: GNAT family N-acetyltransferase, partial [Actinomycetota bacterium]